MANNQNEGTCIPRAIRELEQIIFTSHPDAEAIYKTIRLLEKLDREKSDEVKQMVPDK